MRIKIINDSRVYNEIYIKNWWWEKQDKLFLKILIILIFIVIDKF